MEKLTDIQLIKMARSGDENALDFLLNKYKKLASKIARSYFLIGAEYEDLLQEAMIGLYKAYISYDTTSIASFSTFARTCITRNIQSAVKKANRKKNQILNNCISLTSQGAVDFEDDDEPSIVIPSNVLSPDQQLIESENLLQIKQKIKDSLSKFELEVLSLYLKGYSYTQIAQKLQLTNKSIDNALNRIKTKLSFLKNK